MELRPISVVKAKGQEFLEWSIIATERQFVELQNSVCSIIVGIIFTVNYGRLYDRQPSAYQFFEILPEFVWGLIYTSIGVLHIVSLKQNWRAVRKRVLSLEFVSWIFLGTAFFVGIGWFTIIPYLCFVFALSALRSFFKIQINLDEPK